MILQAPSSWLTALVTAMTSPGLTPGTLQLVRAVASADRQLTSYPFATQIPGMINPSAKSIAVPAGLAPAWLQIPPSAVAAINPLSSGPNAVSMPTAGALQLSAELCCDFRGGWENVFQSIGWAPFTPTIQPVPTCSG
jgi:hypothetical protein